MVAAVQFDAEETQFTVRKIASGVATPYGMATLPDGTLLLTEAAGRIIRLSTSGDRISTTQSGIPNLKRLLDVAIDPHFSDSRLVYLSAITSRTSGQTTDLYRLKLDGNQGRAALLLRLGPDSQSFLYYAGRLLFCGDRALLMSVGDRVTTATEADPVGSEAQARDSNYGKIIRITGISNATDQIRYNTVASGLRNVQGMTCDPDEGDIWLVDHGPIGGDELNALTSAANYGWPIATEGRITLSEVRRPHRPPYTSPLLVWDQAIAPCGLVHYDNDAFPWTGSLFVGSLKRGSIIRLAQTDSGFQQFELPIGPAQRIRDIEVGDTGLIYVLSESTGGGGLYIVEPE